MNSAEFLYFPNEVSYFLRQGNESRQRSSLYLIPLISPACEWRPLFICCAFIMKRKQRAAQIVKN